MLICNVFAGCRFGFVATANASMADSTCFRTFPPLILKPTSRWILTSCFRVFGVFACVLALKDIKDTKDDYEQISEMMNGGKSHALTSASNYKRLTAPCLRP